ncbi:MAG TPA: hypothetical protein VN861_14655 [Candidatus Acidoferrales bacterium]|nr:hypothetical protein [Candidatus Acidoferrales bacterium]
MFKTPSEETAERAVWLAAMVWVALIGAALILVIDYQIKSSILKAANRTWGLLDECKTYTGDAAVPVPPVISRGNATPRVAHQTASGASAKTPRAAKRKAADNGGAGDVDPGLSGLSEPVQP